MSIEEIRRLITTHAHKEDLGLPGVRIKKVTDPTQPTPSIAEPILAFSVQGAKRIALADSVYDQVPETFMTVAVDLPITGHYVQASHTEPYLGFALELHSSSIAELLVEAASNLPGIQAPPLQGISIHPAPAKSLEAFKELASIERPLWGRFPYHLSLEGHDYPLGYVLRTQATAKIAEWPNLSQVDDPDTLVEVTFLPGADKSLTMKLLTIEELKEAAQNESDS